MPSGTKYPADVHERAVRLVQETREQEPGSSLSAVCARIGARVDVSGDTLRTWVRQSEVDRGVRPGTTTDDAKRIKDLEREVKELKRANEILLAASSFFAKELDPRLPW